MMLLAALSATAWMWLALVVVSIALSALFSGFETGSYCLSGVRLRLRADEGLPSARLVRRLLERREDLLIGLLLGNNLTHYVVTAAAVLFFVELGHSDARAQSYATIILTPLLFVAAEMAPKNIFRLHADQLVYRWAGLMSGILWIARACGVVPLLRAIVSVPTRLFRSASATEALGSREAVRSMVLDAAASGTLTPLQTEIADNVLGVAAVTLRNVMVPLPRVVMMSSDYRLDEFRRLAAHFTFSRVPVYAAGNRRRIIGVLSVVEALLEPAETWRLDRLMRPPVMLDVTMPVLKALQTLREQRRIMGIVVDASSHAVGIVTIKDLVEEIVGELAAW